MKKVFAYSAIVLLLAAAASCNKNESAISGDGQIRFALTSPGTRALVESVADLQANQSIKVFDFLDGENYFDPYESVSYSGGAWNYDSGKGYTWKTGTHTFFAYTKDDNACAFNSTDKVVTVSKTLTTDPEDQVDIVYSDIVSKTDVQAKEDSYAPVSLNMDHLFSAVAIIVKNATAAKVTVNSVSTNIPNKGTATIDYSGDAPVITREVSQDGQYIVGTTLSDEEVDPDGFVDILGQTATDTTYWLVWPQEIAEDALTVNVKYTVTAGEGDDAVSTTYEKAVKLPASVWEAGNKYRYTLNICPSEIRLVFEVQPWDNVNVGTIDTASGSINMSNVTWQNFKVMVNNVEMNTLNISAYRVTMYPNASITVQKWSDGKPLYYVVDEDGNPTTEETTDDSDTRFPVYTTKTYDYYPAQGFFTVNYPSSGLFKIELIQASYWDDPVPEGVYEVYIYDKTLTTADKWRKINANGETITNNTVYFQIRATDSIEKPHPEYRAQIDILFKASGDDAEWISAYSEIRANYAAVIPAE